MGGFEYEVSHVVRCIAGIVLSVIHTKEHTLTILDKDGITYEKNGD
jgi:hypothetical protein